MKKPITISILLGFVLLNLLATHHAYRFTHFVQAPFGTVATIESLSLIEKAGILFTGVRIPKPTTKVTPTQRHENLFLHNDQRLAAWYIQPPNPKGIVLLAHGYLATKGRLLPYSDAFQQMGYSTFLLDFRGSGTSSGWHTSLGYHEAADVFTAYRYLKNRFPTQKIYLYGVSMGAVACMRAMHLYDMQPQGVILSSPFASMRTALKTRFDAVGLPAFPLADILLWHGGWQLGFNPYRHRPVVYATSLDVPTLLLWGKNDLRVGRSEMEAVYHQIKAPKKWVIFDNAGHHDFLQTEPEAWKAAVAAFLDGW